VYRDAKVSYTAGDPINYDDDDLFGYMRAPGEGRETRLADPAYLALTPLDIEKNKQGKDQEQAVTRIAPFRVSTLVSVAPVNITVDYGTMARQEAGTLAYPSGPDPVPYEHQFYRTTLQGLISLDLRRVGRFTYQDKTGRRNLDEVRKKLAEERGLTHLQGEAAYLLPEKDRVRRVQALLQAFARLEGGAKFAVHYTDVSPDIVLLAATKGGNNIFGHVIKANVRGLPELNIEALYEALRVNSHDLLSTVYIGWVRGYLDEERAKLESALAEGGKLTEWPEETRQINIELKHPREAFDALDHDISAHVDWLA